MGRHAHDTIAAVFMTNIARNVPGAWVAGGELTFGNMQRKLLGSSRSTAVNTRSSGSGRRVRGQPPRGRTAVTAANTTAAALPWPTAPTSADCALRQDAGAQATTAMWPTGGEAQHARVFGEVAAVGGRLIGPSEDGTADVAAGARAAARRRAERRRRQRAARQSAHQLLPHLGKRTGGTHACGGFSDSRGGSRAAGASFRSLLKGPAISERLRRSAARMRAQTAPNT